MTLRRKLLQIYIHHARLLEMKKRQQLSETQSAPTDEMDFSDTFLQNVFENSETNNIENSFSRSNLVEEQQHDPKGFK